MKTYMTIEGYQTERNPKKYPYTYTRYCIYKNGWRPTDRTVYSDRLMKEHESLYESFLGDGQYLSTKKPEDIEKWLCAIFEKRIILTGMEQECNYLTGYPYWILYYKECE